MAEDLEALLRKVEEQKISEREEAARAQRGIDDKKLGGKVGEIYATAQDRQGLLNESQKTEEENNRRLEKVKIQEDVIAGLEKTRAAAQKELDDENVSDGVKESYREILALVDLQSTQAEAEKVSLQTAVDKSQSEMATSEEGINQRVERDRETLGFDSDVHNILTEIENRRYIEQHKTEINSLTEELLKIYQLSNNSGEIFIRPPVDMIRRLQELMQYPLAFEEVYKAVSKNNPSLARAKFDVEGNPPNLQRMHDSLARDPLFTGLSKVDSRVAQVIKQAVENPNMTQEELLAELGSKYEPEVLAAVQDDANKENEQRDRQKKIEAEKERVTFLEQQIEKLGNDLAKYEVASRFRSIEKQVNELVKDINRKNSEIERQESDREKWTEELKEVEKDKTIFGNVRDKDKQVKLKKQIEDIPLEALIAERDSLQTKIDDLRAQQDKVEAERQEKSVGSPYFPADIGYAVQVVQSERREKQRLLEEAQRTIAELEKTE